MGKIVFLCGMPGSGKSTLGRKLAAKLNWAFVDLDAEITLQSGRNPAKWLRESGEDAFRKEEARVLRNLPINAPTVVACGGGSPCFWNNLDFMKNQGIPIFIDLPLASIEQRLKQGQGIHKRPLLESSENLTDKLNTLWRQREPVFREISWWVNGLNVDLDSLAEEIRVQCQ